jgi:hypothetical protein
VWRRLNQGPYRWLPRLAILLLAGLAWVLWANRQQTPNALTLENRSGQPVAVLRVTIGGQTQTFKDVRMGGSVSAPLGGQGNEHFTVEGQLADGTMIRGQFPATGPTTLVILPGGQITVRPSGKT